MELKVKKADAVRYYNAASEDTKEVLRELFGAEAFAFDYRSIKTYADACEHLGMSEHLITGMPDCDKQVLRQASAAYKLMVICKALNNGKQYDEDGCTWFPVYWFYTKQELANMSKAERKEKGIKLLSAAGAYNSEGAGLRCASTYGRCSSTTAHCAFPLCLNSSELAAYVAEQFEPLIFECWGIEVKEEVEL